MRKVPSISGYGGYVFSGLVLVFISSIRVDPGPRNRDPTSLLALKIRTPVANTGKLRSIGQVPVLVTGTLPNIPGGHHGI
jgi:hypothetical protein